MDRKSTKITVLRGGGGLWLAAWLFTVGYLHLAGWKILFALVVWPYYLGAAVRS